MTKDTSGPEFAFPSTFKSLHPEEQQVHRWGMTLRDYFAAKAMEALILEVADWKYMPNEIANFAYTQADAMLKARNT
jgi:hypothetical protein